VLLDALLDAGVKCRVHDSEAMPNVRKLYGDRLVYCDRPYGALEGADGLAIVTEWKEFRSPDFEVMRRLLREKSSSTAQSLRTETTPEPRLHLLRHRTQGELIPAGSVVARRAADAYTEQRPPPNAFRPREPCLPCCPSSNSARTTLRRNGPLSVLRDVNLELQPGDARAVMGPSGSGKSTLLYILGTLDRPSSGAVRINATDPFALSEPELAVFRNRNVGFVFQDHHLLPQCSVLENVLIPTLARSAAGMPKWARQLLERVGLSRAWSTGRRNCPAANGSAWPSHARSSTAQP
jgi:hypothetical protein